jgi:hypothetical protein
MAKEKAKRQEEITDVDGMLHELPGDSSPTFQDY